MFSDAIEIAVAVVGLGLIALSVRQARTKGWAASLQLAASGFMLMGAAAIGIVGFVVGLVFSPIAWLGVGMLALAGALFMVGQKLEGSPTRAPDAVTESADKPKGQVTPSPKPPGESKRSTGDDEMDDIEAILRRHGIE